ncbi:MAG: hypothetical protein AB7K71_14820 [Polyangiaceae bacterium]
MTTRPPPDALDDLSGFQLDQLANIPDPVIGGAPLPPAPTALGAAPTRAQFWRTRSWALAAAGLWAFGHLGVRAVKGSFHGLPVWYSVSYVGVPFALGSALAFLALRRGPLGLGTGAGKLIGVVMGSIAAFWALAMLLPSLNPIAPEPAGTMSCMGHTLAWVAGPLVLLAIGVRGCFPAGAGWRSAGLGAAAGLFAGALTNLQCSTGGHLHMMLGHGSSAVVAALVGGLLIAKLSRA